MQPAFKQSSTSDSRIFTCTERMRFMCRIEAMGWSHLPVATRAVLATLEADISACTSPGTCSCSVAGRSDACETCANCF